MCYKVLEPDVYRIGLTHYPVVRFADARVLTWIKCSEKPGVQHLAHGLAFRTLEEGVYLVGWARDGYHHKKEALEVATLVARKFNAWYGPAYGEVWPLGDVTRAARLGLVLNFASKINGEMR